MENNSSDVTKIDRIKSIIEKEIEKELTTKQNEVSYINEKIKNVLRNLELLKYVVAVSYFDQNSVLTSKKGQEEVDEDEKLQKQIHPCTKKLLPFQSNYSKSFGDILSSHSYETRKNKKISNNESVSLKVKSEPNESNSDQFDSSNKVKIPQYVPPLSDTDPMGSINSSRGNKSKDCYRVIVGNVSKWILPDTREDNSTHKWMVYVRNKDPNKDITKLLKKVRFFLHESYKPHDIIDVTAPFQLTRRGWGEFPIRVQLHFINPINKPVDIIHNLKLDMTCSGVQMLGGETVVEVGLHPDGLTIPETRNKKLESNVKSHSDVEQVVLEKQDIYDSHLLTSISGAKTYCAVVNPETESEVSVKQEPDCSENYGHLNATKSEEVKAAINNSRQFLLDRRKAMQIIEIEHNYLRTEEAQPFRNITDSILKLNVSRGANAEKSAKNGAISESLLINQLLNSGSQEKLSKMEFFTSSSEENVFKNLKSLANKFEAETQSKYSSKVFRHMYLINILQRAHATKLKSVEPLLRWFVQRWPIVTQLSLDPTYKIIHPYSCPSEDEFFKYSVGKQRSAEWFRAKALQKILKSLKAVIPMEEEIWSTKQILLWCRFHGYFPSLFQPNVKNEFSEMGKPNESSSDSEDGLDTFSKSLNVGNYRLHNGLTPQQEKKKTFKKSQRREFENALINYKGFNTHTEEKDGSRFGTNEFRVLQSNSERDIEIVEVEKEREKESPTKKRKTQTTIATVGPSQRVFNKFVCETARQIGVKITEEEIIPGVQCDSVSRVFAQSVSCFLDELLRKSLAHAWMRNGDRCPESIEINDILATLIEHPRFDIFTNRGMGETIKKTQDNADV